MPNGLLNLALGVAMQVGSPGPSEMPGYPAPANAYGRYGSEGSSEQKYPFDTQQNWVHGYFQEMPAYGGHHLFRPYNYKDVLSQSQTAAGWGERPTMPYSQQFWHKYHDQATMLKTTQSLPPQSIPPRTQPLWTPGWSTARPAQPVGGWSVDPGSQIVLPAGTTGPLHVPAANFTPVNYPETQQPVEVINPAEYRRY